MNLMLERELKKVIMKRLISEVERVLIPNMKILKREAHPQEMNPVIVKAGVLIPTMRRV